MKVLPTDFSSVYAPPETPRFWRLSVAADLMQKLGLVEMIEPPPFDTSALSGLHSERYLTHFDQGIEPLASTLGIPWSTAVRDATYAMLSGQLAAVERAQSSGVCLNLACGFHHAVAERGSAYCALNGLALVAHARPDLRVFVIDCDEHGGNGTESFIAQLPNLYQASIFGTRFGCLGGPRSWTFHIRGRNAAAQYDAALDEVDDLIREHRPDLILYQSGADCHENDPKSLARISADQMFRRDLRVFGMARELTVPIVFVVAGGYQQPEQVAQLNANSVRAALQVFGEAATEPTPLTGAAAGAHTDPLVEDILAKGLLVPLGPATT